MHKIRKSFTDPTLYRSLVRALQYLTITHPDLSYVVNHVSQFLQSLTTDHFDTVKRILRYVKGTIHLGLSFTRKSDLSILGYSDADWARRVDTWRSTYGYSIFLGGNLVSWSARNSRRWLVLAANLNIEHSLTPLPRLCGSQIFFVKYVFLLSLHQFYCVTIIAPCS